MRALQKPCQNCHKPMNGGVYRAPHICPYCGFDHKANESTLSHEPRTAEGNIKKVLANTVITPAEVMLSNKSSSELDIITGLGQVNSEASVSILLTPDMFNADGKFIAAKNETVTSALKQAKQKAFIELRNQAAILGANMLADVAIKNGIKQINSQQANVRLTATANALLVESNPMLTDA